MAKQKRDLYAEITDTVVEALESGLADPKGWRAPWAGSSGELPRNALTRANYRGVNVVHLWITGAKRGYSSPRWATFKQWRDLGASVNKGEKGSAIVFYKAITREDTDTGERETFPVLRYSTVFNAEQVSGDPRASEDMPAEPPAGATREQIADELIAATGAKIGYGGSRAYYRRDTDEIRIPAAADFHSTEGFYGTIFHELGHWTAAPSRCDRKLGGRFGDRQYAAEELIAELCAAFVCGGLGIESEPREDHFHYIANWIAVLKSDKRAIFTAAARAGDAADFIRATGEPEPEPGKDREQVAQAV